MIDDTSKTSVYLKNLIELGIIEREFSVETSVKEKANANRGIYKLTDNFFRFWYAFGFANYSQLEDGDVDGVYEYIIKPEIHEFCAAAFEDICLEFVKQLQRKNRLPFRYARIGRWMGKTTVRDPAVESGTRIAETEIDLLAIDRYSKNFLVGECKFKGKPFTYTEYLNTIAKLESLKKDADFYYALFSENGFDEKIPRDQNSCYLYSLGEIVKNDF